MNDAWGMLEKEREKKSKPCGIWFSDPNWNLQACKATEMGAGEFQL